MKTIVLTDEQHAFLCELLGDVLAETRDLKYEAKGNPEFDDEDRLELNDREIGICSVLTAMS